MFCVRARLYSLRKNAQLGRSGLPRRSELWSLCENSKVDRKSDLRPVGPVAKLQPSPEGLGHRSATSSERRRRGTPNVGSAAPPALHNLSDPSPSPSPDFLWNLVALADFMRLSLLKGARAASSSAAWVFKSARTLYLPMTGLPRRSEL